MEDYDKWCGYAISSLYASTNLIQNHLFSNFFYMCGIWALINLVKDKPDISKHLADFWQLQNRGPDNSCFETFPQAWIGFHRLAIMDTSFKSNQPYILQ